MAKSTAKKWFSDRAFYITIAHDDIESLKFLHTLFDKYLDHMMVKLNKIVWSGPYKVLCFFLCVCFFFFFFLQKMVNNF